MASPFTGIDPEFLKQIQDMMQAMGPSEEDKRAARQHALLTAGLGMMANSTGPTMVGIGRGGLLGQNAYNQELQFNNQQRTANMAQINAYQNLAMQMANRKMMADALGGGQDTQPGPPQAFQAPGGASSLMNAGAAGQDAATSALPTQIPGPQAQNLRARLVNANLINVNGGGKDMSEAIKLKFPDPISMREGADAYDPATQTWTPGVRPPPGSYYDRTNNTFVPVNGGQQAIAAGLALPKAVDLAYTPQIGIGPNNKKGVVGTSLESMFGDGQLPYGAPSPFTGATKAAIDSGQLTNTNGKLSVSPAAQAKRDAISVSVLNDELAQAQRRLAAGDQSAAGDIADIQKTIAARTGPKGSAAVAPPAGRQFVQTELTPEQSASSADLAEYEKSVNEEAKNGLVGQAKLDTLAPMFNRFTPGPWVPAKAAVANVAQQPMFGSPGRAVADFMIPDSAHALPAIAAVNKLAVELTAEQSKVFGSREGQQVIGMIKSAMPSAELVPGAPQVIITALGGLNTWRAKTQEAMAAWKADPRHNGSVEGFQEYWNKTNPPTNYVPMKELEAIIGGSAEAKPTGPLVKNATAIYKAQQAIKGGADPAAVKARLRAAGVDASGL
jgi:hypothetical protein